MKVVDVNTLTHNVGKCPACRAYLWAEVTVVTQVGTPTLSVAEGQGRVYATARPLAMTLHHECSKDADE